MALELVQKVTGKKTTDIVLKHYFQPGREDCRQALHGAMPKLLTTGKDQGSEGGGQRAEVGDQGTAKAEMRELLGQVKPKALREQLLGLLEKL